MNFGQFVCRLVKLCGERKEWAWLGLLGLGALLPSLAFADFPPVQNFPNTGFYQARFLRDKHDIALMQLTGSYNRDTAAGQANIEPRTVMAKEFFRTHPDQYDFLVVFTNFEFETGDAQAFHLGVQNRVKGLGRAEFDNSAFFGSRGKLQGYIDMAALSRYVTNPYDPRFDQVLQIFAHEFLHQWGASVHLKGPGGALSDDLLGKDGSHWSFLLNSGASVEYGNQWRDNGDGSFTSVAGRQFFSPLDLYLMGLYQPQEVPPFFLIENPAIDKTRLPVNDVTIRGVRRNLTIDDVIAAEGPRQPDAAHAQKEFRIGFILASRDGVEPTAADVAAVNAIRKAISTRIEVLTAGRALVQTYLQSKTGLPPVTDPVTTRRTDGVNLPDGFAWLRSKQRGEGNWVDNPFTALRDTAVALDTLGELDGTAFGGRQRALDWLSAQAYSNTDYLARRLRSMTLARQDGNVEAARLLALQNSDGGWGVAPGYKSSPLDTALALLALRPFDAISGGKLNAAVAFLQASQNADGGWGNWVGAVSRTAVSATVLQSLSGRSVAPTVLARNVSFLASRQNADGGFGDSPSTVHDTAQVILALLGHNALAAVRSADASSFVSAAQQTDGSWDGTVFSTALALRLLKSAGLFNWTMRDLNVVPGKLQDGQQGLISFRVANAGLVSAPAGVVRVYDGDPASGGIQIGSDIAIPALPQGDSMVFKLLWNTLNKAGNHTLVALIDPDSQTQESSKLDNRVQLDVLVANAPAGIELQINGSDISVNPSRPARLPSSLAISALLSNIGKLDASAVRVVLREGEGTSGRILDEKIVNLLGRSQQVVNFSAQLAHAGASAFTVQIDPDGALTEGDKANNLAGFTVNTTPALDLEVRADEIKLPLTALYRGADAVFQVKLHNAGTQDSPPFKVRYSVINGSNTVEVATRTLQLAAGAALDQEVIWRSEFAGQLAFKVELDPDQILSETERSNNRATLPFEVREASGANLSVHFRDLASAPQPALEGRELRLSQVVRNSGTLPATDIEVGFYDGEPKLGHLIGSLQKIGSLAPGAKATVSTVWTRYPDAAEHLIFAMVDPNNQQSEITREDNAAFITVSALSLPDVAVSAADLLLTPNAPRPGEVTTLSAKISNLGQQAATNLLVRLYDADPAQGGKPLLPDQTVPLLAPLASLQLNFTLPAQTGNGNRALVLVLDPQNVLEEQRKDNNSARRDWLVQDGDVFVSNRFFSPNGDGVKDDTSFGFRLAQAQDVTVAVLNRAGKVVRRFDDASLKNSQSGSIRWNGLNQRGAVVSDGDYRVRVLSTSGAVLGEALVTVDTNRASLLDAIDTPYEQFTNLSCQLQSPQWPDSMKVTADEERVFLSDFDFNRSRLQNLYRQTTTAADLTPLLTGEMTQTQHLGGFVMAENGGKLVFQYLALLPADQSWHDQLWAINGDGSNLTLLRNAPINSFLLNGGAGLTQDGNALVLTVGAQVQKILLDGVSAETILFDAGSDSIGNILLSPDRRKVLLEARGPAGSVYHIVDVATGQRQRMPADMPRVFFASNYIAWSPDSRLLAMGAMQSALRIDGANRSDARFYVFDAQFALQRQFDTRVGSPDIQVDGAIGSPVWSGDSDELVFGFSYCLSNCAPASLQAKTGKVAVSTPGQTDGSQHVLMRADLVDNRLEAIETTRVVSNGNGLASNYQWLPGERSVLRLRSHDCRHDQGDSCIDAILLDDNNRIVRLFNQWHQAPDVINAFSAAMRVQGLLPSGRKLMFGSTRAAQDPASACFERSSGQYMFGSLQNMTADLRVLRNPAQGGLIVRGSAADKNFARYRIEYAALASPNDWKTVVPASDSPLVDSVMTNWVPPAWGSYWLRLTVEDLAGNTRSVLRRVNWSDTPSITDLYKDVEFISPNGDKVQDELKLHYKVLEPVHLEFAVYSMDNVLLRSVPRDHYAVGEETAFVWDGRNERGQLVPDGRYRITVQDYEFYVNVDTTLPGASLTLDNAYQHLAVPGSGDIVVSAPAVRWTSSDANYNSMLLEHGKGERVQQWLEHGRYPGLDQAGARPLTLDELVGVQYRISVSDKGGNRSEVVTPPADQQVFLLSIANHARNGGNSDGNWLAAAPVPWQRSPATVGGLPRLNGISGGVPLRLEFAESIIRPLSRVVLQYTPLQPGDRELPLGSLDGLSWNEVVINDFLQWNPARADWASSGAHPPEHGFTFLWDLAGVKPQTDYLLRLAVTDEANTTFHAMSAYVFKLNNQISLSIAKDLRPTELLVNASVLWDQPVSRAELLVASSDDPRHAQEHVIDTRYAPNGDYQHYLSPERMSELDLRRCNTYALRLRLVLAGGGIAYSDSRTLLPQCFGATWRAAPQTMNSCDGTPTQKIDLSLQPYSADARRLTQMLLGKTLPGGQEQIVNNWNDVQAEKNYVWSLDTAGLADGPQSYFVRIKNEDGKETTVALPLEIFHQAPQARITSPLSGQKLCGIKARDPMSDTQWRNVVAVEGELSSDSPLSYGLEYGLGANPSSWKTFSPQGVEVNEAGFTGLRQSVAHLLGESPPPFCAYQDSLLCFDFHPLQWVSSGRAIDGQFAGSAAKSGELGRLGLLEAVEGEVSLRLRVFNAAGYQTCSAPVTFDFDNQVKAAPSTLDRKLFSPLAEAPRNQVLLAIAVAEAVTVDVEVLATVPDGEQHKPSARVRQLAHGQQINSGSASFAWDGKDDAAHLSADGWYVLRVTYTDGCGNTLVQEQEVELDATVPQITLSSPQRHGPTGLIVPVIGSVRDDHFAGYSIAYAMAATPDNWLMLASSTTPTPAEALEQTLLNWNTLGLAGAMTLRVQAQDKAGNTAQLNVPLEIAVRSDLIAFLEATPPLFSPNGDNQRDTTSVRFNLLLPAKVTLEVLRGSQDGPVVTTLIKDETFAAGSASRNWDGLGANGVPEANGALVLKLTATALGPQVFSQQAFGSVIIDTVAPQLKLNAPKTDVVSGKGAVTFDVSDAHLLNYQSWFSRNPAANDWTLVEEGSSGKQGAQVAQLDALPEGKYGVKLAASDTAGNTANLLKLFEIDNTPPKAAITSPATGSYWSGKQGLVNIVATLEEKNLAQYKLAFALDVPGASVTELASGSSLPLPAVLKAWDIAALADGRYALWLTADDLAAQSTQAKVVLVVDNTAPQLALNNLPAGSYVRQPQDILGSVLDDNLAEYRIEIAPGPIASASRWSPLGSGTAVVNNGVLLKWQALPPDGVQTLRLRAVDKAGNASELLREVVVDATPPSAPLNLAVVLENRKDARLSWYASPEVDLAGYALYRNGVRLNPQLLTAAQFVDAGLASGNYVYQIKAVDKAGWESPFSNEAALVVSLGTPVAKIFAPLANTLVGGVLDIKGNAAAGKDFREYRLYVGNGSNPQVWQLLRKSPVPVQADVLASWNTIGLPENQPQTLKLEAEDLFGTIVSDSVSVTVDNTAPPAPLQLQVSVNGADVSLRWNASNAPDVAGYIVYRDERVANASGAVVGSLKPYLIAPNNWIDLRVADGNHRYVVQAMDRAENLSDASNAVSVNIDTRPPHASLIKPLQDAKVGRNTYLLATSPDTDIASVQFQYKALAASEWRNLGAAVTKAPWGVNWDASALPFGEYLLQAVATDLTGQVDPAPAAVKVNLVDQQAPDAVLDLQARVQGGDVTLSWRSTDTDIASYQLDRFDASGQLQSRTLTPEQASAFPDAGLADGLWRYRVTAIDTAGNRSAASSELPVLIYTPAIIQPYTPDSLASLRLKGQVPRNGKLTLVATNEQQESRTIEADASADAPFVMPDVPLSIGDNRFTLVQVDALGNVSRSAQFHARRVAAPAMPQGLQVTPQAGGALLSWQANLEPDIIGYHLRQNGVALPAEQRLNGLSVSASSYAPWPQSAWPELVLDNDLTTGWSPDPAAVSPLPAVPALPWLQITLPQRQTVSRLQLNWGSTGVASDYDIQGWDGEVWVGLAEVRNNAATSVNTVLAQSYRTDRLRLSLRNPATIGNVPVLSEVALFGLPSLNATSYLFDRERLQQALRALEGAGGAGGVGSLSGIQEFAVQAENDAGLVSSPATIRHDTGTPDLPDLSVLADSLQVQPVNPAVGSAATVRATISNDGKLEASGFEVVISARDAQGASRELLRQSVTTLAPGATLALTANWTPASPGEHALGVLLDAAGTVTESDESNNALSRTVTVLPLALPQVPVLSGPTRAGTPLLVNQPLIDITGLAAPGAQVTLLHDGSVFDVTRAADSVLATRISTQDSVRNFHATEDGRYLLSSGAALELIDIDTGRKQLAPGVGNVTVARWSHSGQQIAYIGADAALGRNALFLYQVADQSTQRLSDLQISLDQLAWSPDDGQLALFGQDENAQQGLWLLDVASRNSRVLVSGSAWQFRPALAFSPNGQALAFVQDYVLNVADTRSGELLYQHRNPDPAAPYHYSDAPSWSADGNRLLYQYLDGSYQNQVAELNWADRVLRRLSDGIGNHGMPMWLGPDGQYADIDSNNVMFWHAHDGSAAPQLLSQVVDSNTAFSVASGYAFVRSEANVVTRVAPPGTFRFPQVALHAGSNEYSAWAGNVGQPDQSGQGHSATSAPIRITLGSVPLPDLQTSASDIVILPGAPLAGEATRISVGYHNLGSQSARNFGVSVSLRDSNGALTTLYSGSVAALAAGESGNLLLDWTPSAAGQYTVLLSLDAAGQLQEASKSNNQALRTVAVASAALPTLALTLDAASYPANADLQGQVRLQNAGPQFTGTLLLTIQDKDGYPVAALAPQAIAQLATGQTLNLAANWQTGTVLAGEYRLLAQLQNAENAGGQIVASNQAGFVIRPTIAVSSSLLTDKSLYRPQQDVNLAGSVTLQSGNSNLSDASSVLRIVNAAQQVVFERREALGSLLPGTSQALAAVWNTGNSVDGSYRAVLEVRQGEALLASSETGFAVQALLQAQVAGTLNLGIASVGNGDTLSAGYTLQNTGGLALPGMPLQVAIIDPDNRNVLASQRTSLDLPAGSSRSGELRLLAKDWPLKNLQAVLSAEVDGKTVVLQRTTLRVIDRVPPVVTIVSPAAGAVVRGNGIAVVIKAVDAETRVVSVEYASGGSGWRAVAVQDPAQGLYALTLAGGADGTRQLQVRATDASGNVSSPLTLDLALDNTPPLIQVSGVEDGGSHTAPVVPVISISDAHAFTSSITLDEAPFVSGQALRGSGSHRLEIIATDVAGNQASLVLKFDVSEPVQAPALQISTVAPQRLLVLAQCARSKNSGAVPGKGGEKPVADMPDPAQQAACDAARAQQASNWLDALGVSHTAVSTEAQFVSEMQLGGYGRYWLSAGGTQIGQPLLWQLQAALWLGEAVLADGMQDLQPADQPVLDLFGVNWPGQGVAVPVLTTSGGLFATAQYPVLGQALQFEAQAGASTEARFDAGGKDVQAGIACAGATVEKPSDVSCTQRSAIVSAHAGAGATLLFGFDWLASASEQANLWKPLAQAGFNWLLPTVPSLPTVPPGASGNADLIANERIERQIRISNPGAPLRVQIAAELAPGLRYVSGSSGAQVQTLPGGDVVRWQLDLASHASRELNLALQLPSRAGSYNVRYSVYQVEGAEPPRLSLLSSETVPLTVADVAMLASDARAAVNALALAGSMNLAQRAEVLQWLEQAASASANNQPAAALNSMGLAQAALLRITAADVLAAQTALARMARALQRQH